MKNHVFTTCLQSCIPPRPNSPLQGTREKGNFSRLPDLTTRPDTPEIYLKLPPFFRKFLVSLALALERNFCTKHCTSGLFSFLCFLLEAPPPSTCSPRPRCPNPSVNCPRAFKKRGDVPFFFDQNLRYEAPRPSTKISVMRRLVLRPKSQ